MTIVVRDVPPRAAWALEQAGVHPLLARLFAARGISSPADLDDSLTHLLRPDQLKGTAEAARLLADALQAGQSLCVVADYDCDGATACAVALRGLRLLGFAPEHTHYVVPDRAVHGYGLTPAIVDLAQATGASLIVTVDNGIASLDGVAHARAAGLRVLVTDHHLCAVDADGGLLLPDADVIVNPNQPGCPFPSKALAGVGVMFYVLLALRAELRTRGCFESSAQPRVDALLDLVALGTVADVVKLDANNRRLVAQGLKRIRAGRMQAGLAALLAVAGRDAQRASTMDFGFTLGPRINAAGRLADMTLGIECLLTDDATRAHELATQLDAINRERRDVEAGMREQAEALLERLMPAGDPPSAIALFDPDFHEGVVGIVAGRLKERLHRPTFVFARGQDGLLKGSGRSIPGFHLRDALDLVSKRHPGLLRKFGGHAMAAGATLAEGDFVTFAQALCTVADELLTRRHPAQARGHRRPAGPALVRRPKLVQQLDRGGLGPGLRGPPPSATTVDIVAQRIVGERHLKLTVKHAGTVRDAIWFGHADPVPERVRLAYRLNLDEWQDRQRVQMVVESLDPMV